MVGHHVAQRPGRLVERTAFLHADRFGRGDLHVVDVFPAPGRLEQAIGEPDRHDALHGFLA